MIKNICSNIVNRTQILRNNAARKKVVVERASQIYNYSPAKTKLTKTTQGIKAYISPILREVKNESPSLNALSNTVSAIKRNISNARKAPENQGVSNLTRTIRGLRNSKAEVSQSLGEVIGINDIRLAKEQAGTGKAILEGGKSALRVATAGTLSAICIPVPIPGAMIGGWFAGEKLVEKLLGKPFSKQIANLK